MTKYNNGRKAVHRRPRRNAAGQLVDRAGTAVLPGIGRTSRRADEVVQRRGPRSADVRAARTGTHTEGAGTGQRAARRRRRRRRLTRLPRSGVRTGQERTRLHRGSPGGSARLPRQHAMGLHQLRIRLAGGGRHTGPAAQHRACAAGLADAARRRDQLRRPIWDTRANSPTPTRCRNQLDLLATQVLTFARAVGDRVIEIAQRDRSGRRAASPAISKRDKVIRSSCCTAASSASARNSAGRTTSPRWRRTIACSPRTCWGSAARRRSSTSTTAAACGSGTSRASAKSLASRPRTSSATRWARSTCSSTPHRNRRCCRPAAWWRSAAAARSSATNTSPRSTTTTPRFHGMRRIVEAFFTTRPIPPTTSTCSGATSPASRRARGRRWRRPVSPARVWTPPALRRAPRAYERIAVPTLVVEGAGRQTAAVGMGGRDRRADHRGRSAVIQEAGHCPQIEQPAAVNDVLLDFLARATEGAAMINELAGKVAIVTGGASGLGEGLVRRFAAEGAKVVIGDVDRDGGAALGSGHRRRRPIRRSRCVRHRPGGPAGDDGGRAVRRLARDGQQRRGVGHHAPPLPRRRPRRFSQGHVGQCARR